MTLLTRLYRRFFPRKMTAEERYYSALYSAPIMLCNECNTSWAYGLAFNSCPRHGWEGGVAQHALTLNPDRRK